MKITERVVQLRCATTRGVAALLFASIALAGPSAAADTTTANTDNLIVLTCNYSPAGMTVTLDLDSKQVTEDRANPYMPPYNDIVSYGTITQVTDQKIIYTHSDGGRATLDRYTGKLVWTSADGSTENGTGYTCEKQQKKF